MEVDHMIDRGGYKYEGGDFDRDSEIDERKLFVGSLNWNTGKNELKDYFSKYGEVVNTSVKTDHNTGQSRGFAFVVFESDTSVQKVLDEGSHTIDGKKIEVKRARSRPKAKKVFIGGLDPSVSDDEVKSYMSQFGDIEACEFPFDKTKNQRRNFAFIIYKDHESAIKCAEQPKQTIGPKECDVKIAVPPQVANAAKMAEGGGRGGWGAGGARGGGRGRGGYGQGGYSGGYDAYWNNPGYGGGAGAGNWNTTAYPGYDYSQYGYDYGAYYGYDYGGAGYDYSNWYNNQHGYGQQAVLGGATNGGAAAGGAPKTNGKNNTGYNSSYHPYRR